MEKKPSVRSRKPDYEKAVPISISMSTINRDKAVSKSRLKGYSTLSAYIQDLIRKDLFAEAA